MPEPQPPTSGLAITGFVLSIIGLISCGLLAPVGMALSFAAMMRRSDGFAIAGFVIGLLGSLWLLIALALGLFAAIFALFAP